MSATSYWNREFAEHADHHGAQNAAIALDFFKHIGTVSPIATELLMADSVIEVGCGTGEFAVELDKRFSFREITAFDLSGFAITAARERHRHSSVWFEWGDVNDMDPVDNRWDLAICSNVLEHFTDYGAVIDRILGFAARLLVIVPLGQYVHDDFECEGGAGHVSFFDHTSFTRWSVLESVTFRSDGWSNEHSTMQWAVLLEPRE